MLLYTYIDKNFRFYVCACVCALKRNSLETKVFIHTDAVNNMRIFYIRLLHFFLLVDILNMYELTHRSHIQIITRKTSNNNNHNNKCLLRVHWYAHVYIIEICFVHNGIKDKEKRGNGKNLLIFFFQISSDSDMFNIFNLQKNSIFIWHTCQKSVCLYVRV